MKKKEWETKLLRYDELIAAAKIKRKGKTMPYTSDNGYMFSLFNKDAEMGIRLPRKEAIAFKEKYEGDIFKSHGAVMKDYVLIPDHVLEDTTLITQLLKTSHKYIKSLPKK